jgi:transcriptional regulator with XRE-family HTH domain
MNDIGAILKSGRKSRNLTQKKVMELTGIHRKSLSGYENNVAEPDLATFAELLSLYELSADSVLGVNQSEQISRNGLSPEEQKFLTLFRSLDEQRKADLLIQMSALVQHRRN